MICRRNWRSKLWLVASFFCLLVLAVPSSQAISLGHRAPAFTLIDISGRPTTLADLLSDHQAVVLAFGTSWSFQFPQWMQELQRLADRYANGRVAMVAVFLKDRPKNVRLFARRYGLTGGRVLLLVDSNGSLIRPYGLKEIPRLLILDKASIIHYDGSLKKIDDSIALLLRGETVAPQPRTPSFTKHSQNH